VIFGSNRIRNKPNIGKIELISSSGNSIETYSRCCVFASSRNGDRLLLSTSERKNNKYGFDILILDSNFNEIGKISRLKSARKGWSAFQANEVFRFGPDGLVYESFVGIEGVFIFKWMP